MNFIDIASWQAGMDLAVMFARNAKLDGVIVKLTQGTGYVNPYADEWISWLIANGKPFGTYHYMDGSGAEAEARHYAQTLKKYPGGVPALDYEDTVMAKGAGYLKSCLDEVLRLTGVRPLVYCSLSVVKSQDFTAIAGAGYRLWMAQYADYAPVHGFLDKPWQSGSPSPFPAFTAHQYTSCGQLLGWDKRLDFDKVYVTAEEWAAMAGGSTPPAPDPKGPDPQVIADVLDGRYGTGLDRAAALTAAGYDAQAVQRKVNELYAAALSAKPYFDENLEYGNSLLKIIRLL